MDFETISLVNLGGGAALEMFEDQLQKVLENITDVNTDPKGIREITLKLRFKPTEGRDQADLELSSTVKLVAPRGFKTQLFISPDGGRAVEAFRQMELFPKSERKGNVTDFPKKTEEMNHR